MKNKKLAVFIETVVIIALLIAAQLISKVIPSVNFYGVTINLFISDIIYNFILFFSAAAFCLTCSASAALITPILCALLSLTETKMPAMILVFAVGNLALVFIVWVCCRASKGLSKTSSKLLTLVGFLLGASMKLLAMSVVTEKFIITYLKVTKNAANKLLSLVSMQQYEAAIIGGVLAFMLIPALKNALKSI